MPGFERRFNQSLYCGDIDECKNMNPCLNGTCINLPGEYRCLCRVSHGETSSPSEMIKLNCHGFPESRVNWSPRKVWVLIS